MILYKFKLKKTLLILNKIQLSTEKGTIIQFPNNIAYVDTIMNRKGTLWVRNLGPNYLDKQCPMEMAMVLFKANGSRKLCCISTASSDSIFFSIQ